MSLLGDDPLVAGPVLLAGVLFGVGMPLAILASLWQEFDGGDPATLWGVELNRLGGGMVFLAFPIFFAGPVTLDAIASLRLTWGAAILLAIVSPFFFGGVLHLAMAAGRVERGERSLVADAFATSVAVTVFGTLCAVFWPVVDHYVTPGAPVADRWVMAVWVTPFAVLTLAVLYAIAKYGARVGGRSSASVRELFDW